MPSPKTIGSTLKVQTARAATTEAAGTVVGLAIDRIDFQSCVVFVELGTIAGAPTAQTLDVKLQQTDDAGAGPYIDIPGAAITQLTAVGQAQFDVDLSLVKKFVRLSVTVGFTGGTSPTMVVAATIILGGAASFPQ